jgi:hypothetical protein
MQMGRRPRRAITRSAIALAALVAAALAAPGGTASAAPPTARPAATSPAVTPSLGPNVIVFDPSMPQTQIQTTLDSIAQQQLGNQFGTQRYAVLFKPGTYGLPGSPLNFQVGYYTEVAGLGLNPGDTVINGTVDVFNQCDTGGCTALNNFWRSVSNLTINVTNPPSGIYSGCYNGEFWAVSQAAPMRRVQVNGTTTLMDYCTGPSFASGGFIADSRFSGTVINGSQQQFYVRNTELHGWTNGVWNQVFSGDINAPAQCFPGVPNGCGPYTTLATAPASRERPYLYVDANGDWRVFIPSAATNSVGPSWSANTSTPGRSLPLSSFYVASPSDSALTIDAQLAAGRNLLLTPGVYNLTSTIAVSRADTVVLGLGFATLTPIHGQPAVVTGTQSGIDLAGLIVDAGPVNSAALVVIGGGGRSSGGDPTALQDVFFRIGGPHPGKATVSLLVAGNHVILDDIWAWRADHGSGVGWTENTADTGLLVTGDDVTATGLFVEHYQRYEVLWTGERGVNVFFQNEMPYDVLSEAAWRASPTTDGYPAFTVAPNVRQFAGYGMGSYSFFNQGVDIYATNAFQVPTTPGVSMNDLLTVFLDPTHGRGGILHVIDGVGGSSTAANPSMPVTVVHYP